MKEINRSEIKEEVIQFTYCPYCKEYTTILSEDNNIVCCDGCDRNFKIVNYSGGVWKYPM